MTPEQAAQLVEAVRGIVLLLGCIVTIQFFAFLFKD